MKIKITAFGIAKDIIGQREKELEVPEKLSISALKNLLTSQYPEFEALASLSFAVEEEYREDGFEIEAGQEVIIIPPVSGG